MKKQLTFFALLAVLLQGCTRDDKVYGIGNDEGYSAADVLRFEDTVGSVPVPADTQSTAIIGIQVSPQAASSNRSVYVTTDLGHFGDGSSADSIYVDAAGKGAIRLHSGVPGIATITATLKDIRVARTLSFVAAMPDDLLLTADKYAVDTTEAIQLTAVLSRTPGFGKVTDPVKVLFTISGTGADQLVMPQFAQSSTSTANVTLSNPFRISGSFIVTAATTNQQGVIIKRSLSIQIR